VSFLKYSLDVPSAVLAEGIEKKYGVFFVPGSCFGFEYHLRLGLTPQAEIMKQGLERFSAYLDELAKR